MSSVKDNCHSVCITKTTRHTAPAIRVIAMMIYAQAMAGLIHLGAADAAVTGKNRDNISRGSATAADEQRQQSRLRLKNMTRQDRTADRRCSEEPVTSSNNRSQEKSAKTGCVH